MKNLFHQTKQAFFFSLAFYFVGIVLMVSKVPFAPVIVSVSLLVSLIWVFLVLREIVVSPYIDNVERILLALFIIFLNIIAGIVYFYFMRNKVCGQKPNQR